MDRRRFAYARRLEKASQREKYLAAVAVLGVAAGVAATILPGLDLGWPSPEPEIHVIASSVPPGSIARLAPGASHAAAPVAGQAAAPRRVHPYSVVPGGVADRAELEQVIGTDAVVAAHYADFDIANAREVRVSTPRAVYVSYRKGDQVYWTARKVMLAQGEVLLTDGVHEARARCANRISDVPQFPVEAGGPTEEELDSFTEELPLVLPVSAAMIDGLDDGAAAGTGEAFRAAGFPHGAGLVPRPLAAWELERVAQRASPEPRLSSPVYFGGTLGGQERPGRAAAPDADGGSTSAAPTDTALAPAVPARGDAGGAGTTTPDTGSGGSGGSGGTGSGATGTGGTGGTGAAPGGKGGGGETVVPQPATPREPAPEPGPELPPATPGQPGAPDIGVAPSAPVEVPEPGTLWLGGAAFAAMLWLRRRQARQGARGARRGQGA